MATPLDVIEAAGVVPVVELVDGADAPGLARALVAGGVTCIEITLRTRRALAAIEAIRASGTDILLAAGTVLTARQVDEVVDAGASLVVAPGLSRPVVERALERGVTMLPGVVTPTEIEAGLALGLDTFKFFPAGAAGGVAYLRAVSAPYAAVRFVPTGGIGPDTLGSYLALRSVIACGGSWLVPRALQLAADEAGIERLAREAVALVREARAAAVSDATTPSSPKGR